MFNFRSCVFSVNWKWRILCSLITEQMYRKLLKNVCILEDLSINNLLIIDLIIANRWLTSLCLADNVARYGDLFPFREKLSFLRRTAKSDQNIYIHKLKFYPTMPNLKPLRVAAGYIKTMNGLNLKRISK